MTSFSGRLPQKIGRPRTGQFLARFLARRPSDGSRPLPMLDPLIGQTLARYELRDRLGCGGRAAGCRALQPMLAYSATCCSPRPALVMAHLAGARLLAERSTTARGERAV
jgi:hypothetical protein